MVSGPFVLIKFIDNPAFVEELLDGKVYANTPAFYRSHSAPGVGDPYESVAINVQGEAEAANVLLKIDNHVIQGLTGFTLHTSPDQYLHCWMSFQIPEDAEGFNQLAEDIQRIRGEFGEDYVVLRPEHVAEYAKRLSNAVGHDIECGHVAYSNDPLENSPRCKRLAYSYQREFRFLLGECGNKNEDAKIFQVDGGLRDIMLHNVDFRLSNQKTGEDFLRLMGPTTFLAPNVVDG